MSSPKAIEGAKNPWNSIEAALHAANPGTAKHELYQSTAESARLARALRRNETRLVFDDGTYSVRVGREFATIARKDGAEFNVPAGHAWFDRVASADSVRIVEDLHAELLAHLGP